MDGTRRVIHPKTSIAPLPELELFAVPPTQISIERDFDEEIRPLSAPTTGQPIEFLVNSGISDYINFKETYIYVKCRVLLNKDDLSDPTSDDWNTVIPAQYFLHSLFSQCDMLIGNNEVSVSPQTYPYRAYIEAIIAFAKSAKETHLEASLFGSKDYRNQRVRPENGKGITGKWFEMMGRLHIDFTFQHRLLIGGCDVKFKLLPSDSKFYFNVGSGLKAQLELSEVTLQFRKARVYPSSVSAIAEAMRVSPALYPIVRAEVKRVGIPQGQLDFIQDVIRGPMPRRVLVMLVDTNAFNGSFTKDPFEFKNYGINFCAAYMNSTQYPTRAFTPDFEKGLYVREYMKLMQALNQNGTDVYTDLNMSKFAKDTTIFAFNFAPDLTDGPGMAGHANLMNDGVMRLAIRFSKQTTETINVLMYCEYDECIGVDSHRAVVRSFE